jgi:hypothetical protein
MLIIKVHMIKCQILILKLRTLLKKHLSLQMMVIKNWQNYKSSMIIS